MLSTMYYHLVKAMYTHGMRPRPWSPFYSPVLAKDAKWLGRSL